MFVVVARATALWFVLQTVLATTFNVLDYGAIGDGVTVDTVAIQTALLKASQDGGGIVLLPANRTFMSGSLHLQNNTIFRIETGATLLGSPVYTDYPFEVNPAGPLVNGVPTGSQWQRQSLIAGAACSSLNTTASPPVCRAWYPLINVGIDGGGTIDGNGAMWWYSSSPEVVNRPRMVQPAYIHNLTIENVALVASPFWTLHLLLDTHVHIRNLHINASIFFDAPEYSGHNVDGIDPNSCVDVLIEDCVIRAGDDCIAVYSMEGPTRDVYVRNVTCYSPMSVTHGHDTANITFADSVVYGNWGSDETDQRPRWWKTAMRVKSDRKTNGTLQDITYRNIRAEHVDLLVDFTMWYPCHNDSVEANYLGCRTLIPVQPNIPEHHSSYHPCQFYQHLWH